MVRAQIERRGIRDPAVLRAFREVPREEFVPAALRDRAYDDTALGIGSGQTISQPFVVALMIESLGLISTDRVLEIGTGSGYAAALLACIAQEVYTVERHEALARDAAARLERVGCTSVHVRHGDGTQGWREQAPFDAIVVAAGGPVVPPPLLEQLAIGGRLVQPLGTEDGQQSLVRLLRSGPDTYTRTTLAQVRFVPLVGG
jgi:protein-L-isoaspartate(D-aspartate) O-methyltransferase